MIRRLIVFTIIILIFSYGINATEIVEEYLTDEMKEILPEEAITEDCEIDYNKILNSIITKLYESFPNVLKNMMSLIAVVIISAIYSLFSNSVKNDSLQSCFSLLSCLCISMIVYGILSEQWTRLDMLMEDINTFMMSLTPVTTMLYSVGGKITTAAFNNSAMSLIVSVVESICYYCIRPVLSICFGFSLVATVSGNVDLRPMATLVRKTYTTALVFVISSMTCLLSLQNLFTQANDSLALRTVKFASSASIPLVGGSLSEAVTTVGAGISSVRSIFGVLAIISLCIMVLPTVISIWINKLCFSIASTISAIFGLTREQHLISSAGELLGFALAITVSSSAMFVICLSMFAGAVGSLGG